MVRDSGQCRLKCAGQHFFRMTLFGKFGWSAFKHAEMELHMPVCLDRFRVIAQVGCQSHEFEFRNGRKQDMTVLFKRIGLKHRVAVLRELSDHTASITNSFGTSAVCQVIEEPPLGRVRFSVFASLFRRQFSQSGEMTQVIIGGIAKRLFNSRKFAQLFFSIRIQLSIRADDWIESLLRSSSRNQPGVVEVMPASFSQRLVDDKN